MKEAACASFPGTLGPVCSSITFLLVFFSGIESLSMRYRYISVRVEVIQ